MISPDHHQITARKTMEKYLPRWCKKFKQPEISIPKLYKDVSESHKNELLRILNEEGSTLKSIELREKIYIYLTENDIKLYGID